MDAQSVERLTYGRAKTLFVMEEIYYFCNFVRYCFPRPLRFPRALRGIFWRRQHWGLSCCSCVRISCFVSLYCSADRANCLFSLRASSMRRSRPIVSAAQIRLAPESISSKQKSATRALWCFCAVVLAYCHFNQHLSTVDTLSRKKAISTSKKLAKKPEKTIPSQFRSVMFD